MEKPKRLRDLGLSVGELRELQEMKGHDPEGLDLVLQRRKLDRQTHKLAGRLRGAKPEEKEAALAELRTTVDRLYDITTSLREREITRVEEHLKELRDRAKKWQEKKAEIIDRRVKELTGELDYLKW
jgi:predicted  nucleic acid-binding Zn-ribbon protein